MAEDGNAKNKKGWKDGRMEVLQLWAKRGVCGIFWGLWVWLVDDILWPVAIVHHPFLYHHFRENMFGTFLPSRKLAMGSRAGGDT